MPALAATAPRVRACLLGLVLASTACEETAADAGAGTGGVGSDAASSGSGGVSPAAANGGAGGIGGGGAGATSAGGTGGGAGGTSGADAGLAGLDAGAGPSGPCVRATLLWSEDFESGDYAKWTSMTYGDDWGNACQSNGISMDTAVSGTRSQRSEVTCTYTEMGNVHRGYGGLQFDGDTVVPAYTNTGTGIDAPYGVVNTFYSRLDTDTVFENGKWFSFWTVNSACDWSDAVLTLGLEDPSNRLAAAHYQQNGGGERTFEPDAPGFPRDAWARITIYVNYHDDVMHVWQDGRSVSHVTFDRPATTICQWHWGLYASGDNDDLVLYEDDNSLWKLEEPWTDFSREPWLGGSTPTCD